VADIARVLREGGVEAGAQEEQAEGGGEAEPA
jgi:hypothetical protein